MIGWFGWLVLFPLACAFWTAAFYYKQIARFYREQLARQRQRRQWILMLRRGRSLQEPAEAIGDRIQCAARRRLRAGAAPFPAERKIRDLQP